MQSTYALLRPASADAKACFTRANDRFGAIGDLQLAQNVRHVVPYRLGAQDQPRGDLRIPGASSDQVEDFTLAVAELREHPRDCRGPKTGEELHQPGCD